MSSNNKTNSVLKSKQTSKSKYKPVDKNQISRRDLSAIAKESGYSYETLIKWWNGDLNVKMETELAIFEGAAAYYEQKAVKLAELKKGLGLIAKRLEKVEKKFDRALKVLSA